MALPAYLASSDTYLTHLSSPPHSHHHLARLAHNSLSPHNHLLTSNPPLISPHLLTPAQQSPPLSPTDLVGAGRRGRPLGVVVGVGRPGCLLAGRGQQQHAGLHRLGLGQRHQRGAPADLLGSRQETALHRTAEPHRLPSGRSGGTGHSLS